MASGNKRLQGKVALITGSSSGIGEGIALMFAAEGCDISLTGRNEKELERVASAVKEFGVRVIYTTGDLSSDDLHKKLIENTISSLGKIDILVNNAAYLKVFSVLEPNYEDFNQMLSVNLRAIYHLCGLAVPHLLKTKGNIINISSGLSMKAVPGMSSYCISKAGLDMLTRCFAAELAPHGVRVNGVNPGVFKTNGTREVFPDKEVDDAMWEQKSKLNALGRLGKIEELAKFVTFLASDDASFMTGINGVCDGGGLVK